MSYGYVILNNITSGLFAAAGFTKSGKPHCPGWYVVQVTAYFNQAWAQPTAVLSVAGRAGEFLAGPFAEAIHPEFEESEKRMNARFSCIAPRLRNASTRSAAEIATAIEVVKASILTVDGSRSSAPIVEVVEYFFASPGVRPRAGWSCRSLPNDAILVQLSYWDGDKPASADWMVVLDTNEVRYVNLDAKQMSWLPDY